MQSRENAGQNYIALTLSLKNISYLNRKESKTLLKSQEVI